MIEHLPNHPHVTPFCITKAQQQSVRQWPEGEWTHEPWLVTWRMHGYVTQAMRHIYGHLCGYVCISSDHPWHGATVTEDAWGTDPDLTYTRKSVTGNDWVLGFDFCHAGDLVPGFVRLTEKTRTVSDYETYFSATYKNLGHVKHELEHIAAAALRDSHIKGIANGPPSVAASRLAREW